MDERNPQTIEAELNDNGEWTKPDGRPLSDNEPLSLTAWRGTGRADPSAVYMPGVPGCILGSGSDEYFAADPKDAEFYGPCVTQHRLHFRQPIIIDSRIKLGDLTGELPTSVEDIQRVYGSLRQTLIAEGYDGLVVNIPRSGDMGISGKPVKIIRTHFSITQAIKFGPTEVKLPFRSSSTKGLLDPPDEGTLPSPKVD